MKLFFTHLLRSIKKHPLQPFILILTVALSVAFCMSAVSLRNAIFLENHGSMAAEYGSADITVTVGSGSQSRFMLAERANALLSEKGKAVGCFDFILSHEGGDRIFCAAADFYTVGEIFDLSFIEYESVHSDALSDVIFVTQALAEQMNLSLGESAAFDLFGVSREYTVAGISSAPLVGGKEALLDIRAVTKALSYHSFLVSALGDGFLPCTSLFVDLADGVEASEGIALLSADADFADKMFSDLFLIKNNTLITHSLNLIISAAVAVITLVSAAVTFSCFYILSVKRSAENEAFILAGARPLLVNLWQYLEAILYWLVGVPLGIGLSFPLCLLFDCFVGFRFARSSFSLLGLGIALVFSLLSVLLTVAVFIATRNKRRVRVKPLKVSLFLIAFIVLSVILVFLFVGTVRIVSGMLAICLLLAMLLLCAPAVFIKSSQMLSHYLSKRRGKINASLLYAVKNSENVKVLHNTARLVALLFAALLSTGSLVLSSVGYSHLHGCMLRGDYAVTNPTERLYEKLCAETEADVSRVYQQTGNMSGYTVFILSSDAKEVFGEELHISALPTESEVILSSVVAKALSVKVGDEVLITTEGKSLRLFVSEIVSAGISCAVIDGAYHGLGYNLLIASAGEGKADALYQKLTEAAASEMSAVFKVEELLASRVELLDIFLVCGYIIAAALLIFALIGLLDNLYESYKHRRSHFALYSLAGADVGSIRKMKRFEIFNSIGFGILFGALIFIPVFFVFNRAAYSLNYEFILCIREYFGM